MPVLAEVYRGEPADAAIDRLVSTGVDLVGLSLRTVRLAGRLRSVAGTGSAVDSIVVATAIRLGGGIVATGDHDDLAATGCQPSERQGVGPHGPLSPREPAPVSLRRRITAVQPLFRERHRTSLDPRLVNDAQGVRGSSPLRPTPKSPGHARAVWPWSDQYRPGCRGDDQHERLAVLDAEIEVANRIHTPGEPLGAAPEGDACLTTFA